MMIPVKMLLERGATYRNLDSGELIFNEGAPALFYYQLVSGRVRWTTLTDDGREILHKVVCPGESFGEYPLFDGGVYAASSVADSPTTLIRLSAPKFLEIIEEHPDIHLKFSRAMVADLRFNFMLTDALSSNNPEQIVSRVIQHLNQDRKLVCQDCNRLMLTRQQLANITGLRVETVIRVIKNMEREEKLSIVKGKVFIPSDGIV